MNTYRTPAEEHQSAVLTGIGLATTEHAPMAMATMEGASHIVRFANLAFCQLLGKSTEDMVGRPFAELMPDKDECLKRMDLVFRTGRPESHTEQEQARPRTFFWSYAIWPVMVDGSAVGVMLQVTETESLHEHTVAMNEELMISSVHQHELTEMSERLNEQLRNEIVARQKTTQELAEKARLLDLSTDAIVVLDVEHRIQFWNQGAEELYGWSREEAVGKRSHDLLHTTFSKPFEEIAEELYRTNRWSGELIHTKRDGQRISVLVRKVLDRDDHGNPVAILESMTDITERTKAEAALREAQARLADRAGQLEGLVAERTAELKTTNQQLEAFVYSIAHDLRAPLRSMQGFSVLLAGDDDTILSETGRGFAERIDKAAQFMDALLSDLLAFSRISQQHVVLAAVRLDTVLKSVASRLGKDMHEESARLEHAGPWPMVLAHEPTLEQVLFNLMSNALKFTVPDRPPLVRVWTEDQGEFVRVWVGDNGPGIAAEHQEQIFRPFTRLDGEKHPGTGIGLAIVQKGVERLGGRAGVESTLGEGSRFWFELRKA